MAGRKAVLGPGDIREEAQCQKIIDAALENFGQVDIFVKNAAFQMSRESLQEVSNEEWEQTFKTNIYPMFYLCKLVEPHMKPRGMVINSTSIGTYKPKPTLIGYAAAKGVKAEAKMQAAVESVF